MSLRIFIVEDDPDYAAMLRHNLLRMGTWTIYTYASGEEALANLTGEPDLVLLDLVLPGEGGIQILKKLKVQCPSLPVVVVSAQNNVSVALEAMRLGAYEYVTKGYDDIIKLRAIVGRIADRKDIAKDVESLRRQLPASKGLENIVGESTAMARVFQLIKKALPSDLIVTIIGESGTGKELIAQAIHNNSKRAGGSFVVVNCAAIPRDLLESEFFGHEKGAFTGAHLRKIGKFEQAHNGTLFLDEIGEMSPDLQAKLLRVLQNREITRVGGNTTISIDARILCATNRDIEKMVQHGDFREDLYYRLFQFPIYIPPLRQRDHDALLLADLFVHVFTKEHPDLTPSVLSNAARRFIQEHQWPGNVRQLKYVIERAMLICEADEIQVGDLLLDSFQTPASYDLLSSKRSERLFPKTTGIPTSAGEPRAAAPIDDIVNARSPDEIVPLEELKTKAVRHAYILCDGNIEKTAARLGVARSTVYRLLDKGKN